MNYKWLNKNPLVGLSIGLMANALLLLAGCQDLTKDPGCCFYNKQVAQPGYSTPAGNSNPSYSPAYGGGPPSNAEWGDHVQKVWWNAACVNYFEPKFNTESGKLNCLRNDNRDRLWQKASESIDGDGTTYRWRDTDYPAERQYSYDKCEDVVPSTYTFLGKCTYSDMEIIFYDDGVASGNLKTWCEDRAGTWTP